MVWMKKPSFVWPSPPCTCTHIGHSIVLLCFKHPAFSTARMLMCMRIDMTCNIIYAIVRTPGVCAQMLCAMHSYMMPRLRFEISEFSVSLCNGIHSVEWSEEDIFSVIPPRVAKCKDAIKLGVYCDFTWPNEKKKGKRPTRTVPFGLLHTRYGLKTTLVALSLLPDFYSSSPSTFVV